MTVRPYPLRLTEQTGDANTPRSLISRVLRKPLPDAMHSGCVSLLGHADQRVANGSFANQGLSEVATGHRSWMAGAVPLSLRASFVDSGDGSPVHPSDSTLISHVLWCEDDRSAHVLAGIDPAAGAGTDTDPERLVRRPISPGDTIVIPAGVPHAFGRGILAYHLAVESSHDRGSRDPVPSHGLSRFHAFNRRTTCAAGEGFALERWKITQPLRLERPADRWMFVTNLVEPVAMSWSGGSELIGQGESRLLPASLGPITLIPNGIAYVLCLYVPDLVRDVIAPLHGAGYRDDEITTVTPLR